jgi:hypothetical protein
MSLVDVPVSHPSSAVLNHLFCVSIFIHHLCMCNEGSSTVLAFRHVSVNTENMFHHVVTSLKSIPVFLVAT